MTTLPRLTAVRYLQPLREGGSLPAVVDTDDGIHVVKFRGAGQGPKALVAELACGLIAQLLDLPVPELALVDIRPELGASEPDPEIQDLLRASHGINVGLRYLDGAFNFAVSAAGELIGPQLAARIVWLDALLTNPDRTHRNPNILIWQRQPWLIDHGAALYAHHDWRAVDDARTRSPFPLIRNHVLLAMADEVRAADAALASRLDEQSLATVLAAIPDELLLAPPYRHEFASADAARARYLAYLRDRLAEPRAFVTEADAARARIRAEPAVPVRARR